LFFITYLIEISAQNFPKVFCKPSKSSSLLSVPLASESRILKSLDKDSTSDYERLLSIYVDSIAS